MEIDIFDLNAVLLSRNDYDRPRILAPTNFVVLATLELPIKISDNPIKIYTADRL